MPKNRPTTRVTKLLPVSIPIGKNYVTERIPRRKYPKADQNGLARVTSAKPKGFKPWNPTPDDGTKIVSKPKKVTVDDINLKSSGSPLIDALDRIILQDILDKIQKEPWNPKENI